MSADEYMQLIAAYKSTRGHEIYWQIHSVTVSHGLFLGNQNELAKKLVAHSDFSVVARLYQVGHYSEMQVEFREIMRLIHNYVAAVKSLVDHTRRIANKLIDGEDLIIYQQRVDSDFKDDALTTFLHDLRNYLLHVSHPPVRSTMRFSNSSINSIGIELSPQELLRWDGWRKPSVQFIECYTNGIPLAKLVADYERKVYQFYNWLIDHLNNARKPELDEFWAKHHNWANFCKQNGIPVTDEERRQSNEAENGA